MIQSSSYTIDVKGCSCGSEINGDSTFSWQITEGTSSNMRDLLACIDGTSSFLYVQIRIYILSMLIPLVAKISLFQMMKNA